MLVIISGDTLVHDDTPRPQRRLFAAALLLATFGCANDLVPTSTASQFTPGTQTPVLETTETNYSDRAVITVRLINPTSRALGYNLCRSKLERIVDGNWEVMQDMLAEFCTAELRTLPPGRAVAFSFRPKEGMRGRMRIRTELYDRYNPRVEAVSNLFEMRVSRD